MSLRVGLAALVVAALCQPAAAQDATTREEVIAQAEAEKAAQLRPFVPDAAETAITRISDIFLNTQRHVHAFWVSVYSGGGFTMGAGYLQWLGDHALMDTRGSITFSGYKRIESEVIVPRLFKRRATWSTLAGWREATQVGFYGLGMSTSVDDRVNYRFQQPYASTRLDFRPTRGAFALSGGFEVSRWGQEPSTSGDEPPIDSRYTPGTLAGLDAQPVYLHTQGSAFIDTRPSPGYARYGGYYGATVHDYSDTGGQFGFTEIQYDAIQHVPILRESWVASFHARFQQAVAKSGEAVPFFMLPSLGGGDYFRAFSSWRFREHNALLMQAEWRVMVNRFVDMALFADAGQVAAHPRDLNMHDIHGDGGIGFRFHGPLTTPLRIELAVGPEGLALVFGASQAF